MNLQSIKVGNIMEKHNLNSIEYQFRKNNNFKAKTEYRNSKDVLPEAINLLFTKIEDYDLLNFFNENGFNYSEVVKVNANGDNASKYVNKAGEEVEAPENLEITFKTQNGRMNTWKINDYTLDETYKIWSVGVPFAEENNVNTEINTQWRAYMLARFGAKTYGEGLKAQLAFEGYEQLPATVKSGKTKGEKVAKYQRDEMRKIFRLARDMQNYSPILKSVRDEQQENIATYYQNLNR